MSSGNAMGSRMGAKVRAPQARRKQQKRPSHRAGFCYIAPHADPR
jgi:hypothetical protein